MPPKVPDLAPGCCTGAVGTAVPLASNLAGGKARGGEERLPYGRIGTWRHRCWEQRLLLAGSVGKVGSELRW